MADLGRDIHALPDDVDEELKEMLLRLAKNDPSLTNADLRFKLEGSGAACLFLCGTSELFACLTSHR